MREKIVQVTKIFPLSMSDVPQWEVRGRARERHRLRGRVPQEDGQRGGGDVQRA